MKWNSGTLADPSDLFDRLNRAGLVIAVHDRNQDRIRVNGGFHILDTYKPVCAGGEVANLSAHLRDLFARSENRFVLNL